MSTVACGLPLNEFTQPLAFVFRVSDPEHDVFANIAIGM
jgi:hypothetical protein